MENDYDYLAIKSEDKQVLKNLSDLGKHLRDLQLVMLAKEAEYQTAKKAYEHFANVILPTEMFSAGINSLSLDDGSTIAIKRNFYCQPNKNAADKLKIVEWLRSNGGEHLVECDARVSALDLAALQANNIPYIEETTVNTNKLKSFLKDKIGATTGVQQINPDDIPACIHFQEVTSVEINVPNGGK